LSVAVPFSSTGVDSAAAVTVHISNITILFYASILLIAVSF